MPHKSVTLSITPAEVARPHSCGKVKHFFLYIYKINDIAAGLRLTAAASDPMALAA